MLFTYHFPRHFKSNLRSSSLNRFGKPSIGVAGTRFGQRPTFARARTHALHAHAYRIFKGCPAALRARSGADSAVIYATLVVIGVTSIRGEDNYFREDLQIFLSRLD